MHHYFIFQVIEMEVFEVGHGSDSKYQGNKLKVEDGQGWGACCHPHAHTQTQQKITWPKR